MCLTTGMNRRCFPVWEKKNWGLHARNLTCKVGWYATERCGFFLLFFFCFFLQRSRASFKEAKGKVQKVLSLLKAWRDPPSCPGPALDRCSLWCSTTWAALITPLCHKTRLPLSAINNIEGTRVTTRVPKLNCMNLLSCAWMCRFLVSFCRAKLDFAHTFTQKTQGSPALLRATYVYCLLYFWYD